MKKPTRMDIVLQWMLFVTGVSCLSNLGSAYGDLRRLLLVFGWIAIVFPFFTLSLWAWRSSHPAEPPKHLADSVPKKPLGL